MPKQTEMVFFSKGPFIFTFFIMIGWSSSSVAAEAAYYEGGTGAPTARFYGLDGTRIHNRGNLTYSRFHMPFKQTRTQILSVSLSNQYYDGIKKVASSDYHTFSYSAFGLGLSYRYRFMLVGADYQFAAARQSLIGSFSDIKNYSFNMPNFYTGFLFRLGRMGIGVNYYSKFSTIPKKETGLSKDRYFSESGAVFALSYHWDGTADSFFDGLFKRQ